MSEQLDFPDVDYKTKFEELVAQRNQELEQIAGWQRPIRSKIDRVEELHKPYMVDGHGDQYCTTCSLIAATPYRHPCITIKRLRGEP
ncbi:hypothetical protein [Prescottella agglutinans]|uniref:Uncharacterized protein n=1 Tax=Prescottella agglutinans TaxID=1644129 RepID=A0ABT6MEY2_9NOCA|nr:hypothetical protein [Prescottella agglutinans]MDH6282883.1 hypothetical protein [Prescottella agglutinans]